MLKLALLFLLIATACRAQVPMGAVDPSQQLKTADFNFEGPRRGKAFATGPVVRRGQLLTVQGPAFEDLEKDTPEELVREARQEPTKQPSKKKQKRRRGRR
jgi:hypothetical protein